MWQVAFRGALALESVIVSRLSSHGFSYSQILETLDKLKHGKVLFVMTANELHSYFLALTKFL